MGVQGKRVKIPHGPATVIGEPPARIHWRLSREGGGGIRAISQETCLEKQVSLDLFEE